jgi:uncharacterized protein
MKWDRGHRSNFVEDRRGMSAAGGGGGLGLLFILFRVLGRFGIGGFVLAALLFGGYWLWSGGGAQLFGGGTNQAAQPIDDDQKAFVSFVLDDVQAVWAKQFEARGTTYQPARLILFTDRVNSACGLGSAATGPFYCPGDQKIYIDLSFYQQLRERLGAPGDFAQAYVIGHEIGHHIQNLSGDLDRGKDRGASGGAVRVELQADCYAGVWAHDTSRRDVLEAGDIEEAMRAAEAIGDDTLQRAGTGTVQPETWTHGSAAQRMRWFERGYRSGSVEACDTFGAAEL